uniref:ARF GTPase-activating protein GIT2 n=1 Tax=Lygus hesperus TaxID=30085 RepID=A0A0A9YJU9_LYGHE
MPNDFQRFGNARPPQSLNNRIIYRYTDTTNEENDKKEMNVKSQKEYNRDDKAKKNKKLKKQDGKMYAAYSDTSNNDDETGLVIKNVSTVIFNGDGVTPDNR